MGAAEILQSSTTWDLNSLLVCCYYGEITVFFLVVCINSTLTGKNLNLGGVGEKMSAIKLPNKAIYIPCWEINPNYE